MAIDAMDEDALLQQALALSMQVDQQATATPAPATGAQRERCQQRAWQVSMAACNIWYLVTPCPHVPPTPSAAAAPTPAAPSKAPVAAEAPGVTPGAAQPAAGGGGDEAMEDLVDDPEVRAWGWGGMLLGVAGSAMAELWGQQAPATTDPLASAPPACLLQLALALQMSLAEAQQPPQDEEKE